MYRALIMSLLIAATTANAEADYEYLQAVQIATLGKSANLYMRDGLSAPTNEGQPDKTDVNTARLVMMAIERGNQVKILTGNDALSACNLAGTANSEDMRRQIQPPTKTGLMPIYDRMIAAFGSVVFTTCMHRNNPSQG